MSYFKRWFRIDTNNLPVYVSQLTPPSISRLGKVMMTSWYWNAFFITDPFGGCPLLRTSYGEPGYPLCGRLEQAAEQLVYMLVIWDNMTFVGRRINVYATFRLNKKIVWMYSRSYHVNEKLILPLLPIFGLKIDIRVARYIIYLI